MLGMPTDANTVIGAVTVTWTGVGLYPGQITLGGTDAPKFALTNSGFLPCNLVIGSVNVPAGNYSIALTAN